MKKKKYNHDVNFGLSVDSSYDSVDDAEQRHHKRYLAACNNITAAIMWAEFRSIELKTLDIHDDRWGSRPTFFWTFKQYRDERLLWFARWQPNLGRLIFKYPLTNKRCSCIKVYTWLQLQMFLESLRQRAQYEIS